MAAATAALTTRSGTNRKRPDTAGGDAKASGRAVPVTPPAVPLGARRVRFGHGVAVLHTGKIVPQIDMTLSSQSDTSSDADTTADSEDTNSSSSSAASAAEVDVVGARDPSPSPPRRKRLAYMRALPCAPHRL